MESNGASKWILGLTYAAELAELYFMPFIHRKKAKGNRLTICGEN